MPSAAMGHRSPTSEVGWCASTARPRSVHKQPCGILHTSFILQKGSSSRLERSSVISSPTKASSVTLYILFVASSKKALCLTTCWYSAWPLRRYTFRTAGKPKNRHKCSCFGCRSSGDSVFQFKKYITYSSWSVSYYERHCSGQIRSLQPQTLYFSTRPRQV